jgi:hypothetical protein
LVPVVVAAIPAAGLRSGVHGPISFGRPLTSLENPMTVRVEQTKVGTFVEWEGVESPATMYELAPGHEVQEGEVAVEGEVIYGTTFTAKPSESDGELPR